MRGGVGRISVLSVARAAGVLAGFIPLALAPVALVVLAKTGQLAFDTRHVALPASDAFVHHRPLYFHPSNWARAPFVYVYPPLWAIVISPLLLLPASVGNWLAAVVCLLAVPTALAVLGVRDARVLALSLLLPPVLVGGEVANASAIVTLLVAVAWRRGAIPLAAAIAVKLMAWPLLLWFALRRGVRSAVLCAAIAAAAIGISWAAVGFQGLGFYRDVLTGDAREWRGVTFGIAASGWPHAGELAVALVAASGWMCWRRWRTGDPVGSFAYGILAALVASPIAWITYFSLALLPLALRRPRLSAAWFLPLLLWIVPGPHSPTTGLDKLAGWAVVGALLVWSGSFAERRPLRRPKFTAQTSVA
jgi:hypothetical protein